MMKCITHPVPVLVPDPDPDPLFGFSFFLLFFSRASCFSKVLSAISSLYFSYGRLDPDRSLHPV